MQIKVVVKSSGDQAQLASFAADYEVGALELVSMVEVAGKLLTVSKRTFSLESDGTLRLDVVLADRVFWLERINRSYPDLAKLIAVTLIIIALGVCGFTIWLLFLADAEQTLSILGLAYYQGAWLIGLVWIVTLVALQSVVSKRFGQTASIGVGIFVTVAAFIAVASWNNFALHVTQNPRWPEGYRDIARQTNQDLTLTGGKLLVLLPPIIAILQLFAFGKAADFLKFLSRKPKDV